MPRHRHRLPEESCRRVDQRNGIVVCRRCRYYRPLSEALKLGYACHYSLDTGRLRGIRPVDCYRRPHTCYRPRREMEPE